MSFFKSLIGASCVLFSVGLLAVQMAGGPQFVDKNDQPLAGAEVLVGTDENQPFPNNILTTDAHGRIVVPAGWDRPLPLSFLSPNYVTSTFLAQEPGPHVFRISSMDGNGYHEVRGEAEDFGPLKKDGFVDFAMVIPGLTRDALLGFDVSSVVSPEVDTIRIVGRSVDIPSNLALPKQQESYILPITLNKPTYRIFTRSMGEKRFMATHGKFPLKKVVDDMRAGKSVFEVINHFNFVGGGIRTVFVQGDKTKRQDISVNSFSYDTNLSISAPRFGQDLEMVSASLIEVDGYLYPTDVKRALPGETLQLKVPAPYVGNALKVSIMQPSGVAFRDQKIESLSVRGTHLRYSDVFMQKERKAGQLSFVVQNANAFKAPEFLDLIDAPKLQGNQLVLVAPTAPSGVAPMATIAIFSEIEKIENGKIKSERKTRLWEVYSDEWLTQIDLPRLDFQRDPSKTYRWEVMYLGSDKAHATGRGYIDLNEATHVTRNSINL